MSLEDNKTIARRFLEDVWGKLDRTAAEEIVAADVTVHDGTFADQPPGPEGQIYAAGYLVPVFPDMNWMIEDMIAEGDRVVYRWSMRATHQGALGNIEPTGRQVTWTGIDILRIKNGKITEIWHQQADLKELLT